MATKCKKTKVKQYELLIETIYTEHSTRMSTLGLSLCQRGLAPDRTEEPGDAPPRLQLPLSRAEARGDRGRGGLHPEGVEDT